MDLSRIQSPASGAHKPPDSMDPRLKKAASEFEAMLLANLWQTGKSAFGGEESDAAGENLQDMSIRAMCAGVSKAGGLGIAKALIHALSGQQTKVTPKDGR